MKKIATILLAAVIIICNMYLIATAEPGATDPANATDAPETVQSTAAPDTEQPETEPPITEPSETGAPQTQAISSDSDEGNIVVYTSYVLRSEEQNNNNDDNGSDDDNNYDNQQGAAVATDDESYSKTTRSVPSTAKPTTKAKNINDFGQKYRVAKWVALVLMILSAGGLILINTLNYKSKKEAEKKRRAKAMRNARNARNADSSRDISSHSKQSK